MTGRCAAHCSGDAAYEANGSQQQGYASFPGRHTAASEASTSYLSDEVDAPAAPQYSWRKTGGAIWGLLRQGNELEGAVRSHNHPFTEAQQWPG